MKEVMFGAGETVFSEGEDSTHTYRIIAGSVDIVVTQREGGEAKIGSIGPDEVFGEMGIIDPGPRSATAIAREPTVCMRYTPDEVMELMSSNPEEAVGLLRSLVVRLRQANRKLAAKAPLSPPKRPV